MDNEKYIFKIITMGDANSGKTMLCNRICKKNEENGYHPTIGIEFNSIDMVYNDKNIKLQMWDTAGQECFAPIVRNYYKKILGIFFVIDLTSDLSIKNIDYWLNEFEENRVRDCETIIIAFGNKIDCENRVISYEKISGIFEKKGIDYFEISAKNNENVQSSLLFFLDKVFTTFDINDHPGIYLRNLMNDINVKSNKKYSRNSCSYLVDDQKPCCNIS